ncbi:helix-turn-helix domain-containing protein [Pirellulaceae bacterium SH501]
MTSSADPSKRALGDMLRRGRRETKRTLVDVAGLIGCSIAQVSKVERGEGDVPDDKVLIYWSCLFRPEFDIEALLKMAHQVRLQCVSSAERSAKWDELGPRMLQAIEGALRAKELWGPPETVEPEYADEARVVQSIIYEFEEIVRKACSDRIQNP